ncbi:hypothetical protein [Anaerocolumna sp. MB42-C2]|uniref:hypothetical protein n=1 Tax=Anaerocolumna sp. MB42-C2 TaxID=3070997 RepID=UPI0027DF617E|nr:hypothetical protein [Anaerocolumna sp. MB42-C2]WMJ88144.1 hypothetical protein RBU59_01175 [Anaerocolumna sp. MB42-C2]
MNQLIEIAKEVKKQNLNFQIQPSRIQEINIVMDSLNQMKNCLQDSLEKQWNMEQSRKTQVSA